MNAKQEQPEDENKRRFREALEAKNNRHKGEDHLDGGPSDTHAHGPASAKRVFRRKTG